MSHGTEHVDVLLVCTAGGHLLQLWSLRQAWSEYDHAWVVGSHGGGDVESLLEGERLFYAHSPAARSLKNAVRNVLLARRLIKRLRPQVLVTTGAAVAVPFAWVARAHGVRVAYVETLARAERPSLSCRLARPIADRVYVQWPELVDAVPGARYAGTVFGDR
ncbi:UDP-N-acetylglucosamine--LPS N-acetylglucosamine transferase [Solirubrobacter sp. CPCC 204708]|uniref:UDP-N-acetylglucosamine transferase subunit ALG14 n=1 Tax=Solirubrobacter deserti TaxID=2282478 RepID=A0ABT4RIJ8_9ACTN|nr:UDP-N-acetylglucosamine--LPS N-acetylglucosamine transferase [Solirubrobacter deserti]MBE2320243.1 UDP-N-acetylglucosamine--LPS N-acetylglucosamine transferase [Solirubrobacter deserti]MDA0138371.1 UDP-N-acetylglucosamine transferase subunit ALG14 [Solirubrobacter deserti]